MPTNLKAPGLVGSPTDDNDEIAHVLNLVGQLPEQERLAVRIFFLSERNIAETAQHLELSRSGAYEVIKRAARASPAGWASARRSGREDHELLDE